MNNKELDELLQDSTVYAIVQTDNLKSQYETETVHPPTFAASKGKDGRIPSGYNIGETGRCVIDTQASQNNRYESMFKEEFREFIPSVAVEFDDGKTVDILDAPHRAADAVFLNSTLLNLVEEAFLSYLSGNSFPLIRNFPTTALFGGWDSRGTMAKVPGVVKSWIDAFKVHLNAMNGRSQFFTAVPKNIGEAQVKSDKDRSVAGLADVPNTNIGYGEGVVADTIIRTTHINLDIIRGHRSDDDAITIAMQRYLFGLSLLCATKRFPHLRARCDLYPVDSQMVKISNNGKEQIEIDRDNAVEYMKYAVDRFGVWEGTIGKFDGSGIKKYVEKCRAKNGK